MRLESISKIVVGVLTIVAAVIQPEDACISDLTVGMLGAALIASGASAIALELMKR